MRKKIPQRTRLFLPVEGEGEQSVIKWLQYLSDKQGLHLHLDCQVLGGGGYEIMLEKAVRYRMQKERQKAKSSILVVDADRGAAHDDGWSHDRLRKEAIDDNIEVCFQQPNLEGLLFRLLPGNERLIPVSAANARRQLERAWPVYEKPADARTLIAKFSLDDLLRVAKLDSELNTLLSMIGLSH